MSGPIHSDSGQSTYLAEVVRRELERLSHHGTWFLLFGILLVVAGTAAIIVPAATVGTTFAAALFIGILLMASGVATLVQSFWIGQWGGFFLHLLAGILYIAAGFVVTENPLISAVAMTVFIAASWIVLGVFRSISALVIRFPQWGWSLLNGVVTLIAGIVIFRRLPLDAFWVIGLLVGLEMLFNGLSWMMLGVALRRIRRAA